MRKAGVWLGLIEDDEDRAYDDRGYSDSGGYRETASYRERESRFGDEFDDDEDIDEVPAVPRARATDRSDSARAERTSVRSITRPGGSSNVTTSPFATRDNLALAAQPVPRERSVATEDED